MSGFKYSFPFLVLFCVSCSVSQQSIERNIIGTWACVDGDINRGGMTFYSDGQFSLFHRGDVTSSEKISRVDHFAKGRYKIHNDYIISVVSYRMPVVKGKEQLYQGITVPKGEITLRRQVARITHKQMHLVYHSHFDERKTATCEKVYEARVGQHYNNFLKSLGVTDAEAFVNADQPPTAQQTTSLAEEVKKFEDGINIISDSFYHRKVLAKLLGIVKQLTPRNIRVMSLVGQDLHYQISGMADSEETVKAYVQNLQNSDVFENATVAESHTFNILSTSKGHQGSQQLYEFRISLEFKSNRGPTDDTISNYSQAEQRRFYQKRLTAAKSLFSQESKALVKPAQLPTILSNLKTIANESTVSFTEFKPHDKNGIGPVIEIPIGIKVQGTYKQINQFLKKLADDQHTIGLTGIQIEPDFNNIKSTDLTLAGYLNIFALSSDQGTQLQYDLNNLESDFPQPNQRETTVVSNTVDLDPFHYFSVNVKSNEPVTQASLACQSNQNINADIDQLRYLGLKNDDEETALLEIQNQQTLQVKAGQCLNKMISIEKITRDKLILKQTVEDEQGVKKTRQVSLSISDED